MSDITTSFNQRSFLIPRADFTTDSQKELLKLIMFRHGETEFKSISLIDENDDYDSFYVETGNNSYCVKISFDQIPIFYEYMILKGIQSLNVAPAAIIRNEIEYGKTIYYTIMTYEHSDNLKKIGPSLILDEDYTNFDLAISKLHTSLPPEEIHEYFDNTESYLQYHKINFNNILQYVDENEVQEFEFIKFLYDKCFSEMFLYFKQNESNIELKKLVHGNLDCSTIIENTYQFKFINFENAFIGSPFFDLCNLVYELQMSGIKEHDFITKKIKQYNLVDNRFKSGKLLKEYSICKYIWNRKKFLDLICDYVREVIILNKSRIDKLSRLGHEFSNHYYRFSNIEVFNTNRDVLVKKFNDLILNFN